jgi:hypothetical protein
LRFALRQRFCFAGFARRGERCYCTNCKTDDHYAAQIEGGFKADRTCGEASAGGEASTARSTS